MLVFLQKCLLITQSKLNLYSTVPQNVVYANSGAEYGAEVWVRTRSFQGTRNFSLRTLEMFYERKKHKYLNNKVKNSSNRVSRKSRRMWMENWSLKRLFKERNLNKLNEKIPICASVATSWGRRERMMSSSCVTTAQLLQLHDKSCTAAVTAAAFTLWIHPVTLCRPVI